MIGILIASCAVIATGAALLNGVVPHVAAIVIVFSFLAGLFTGLDDL